MTASVCINNAGAEYFFVLNFIEFKLSRVSEMLKNLTIFIGYFVNASICSLSSIHSAVSASSFSFSASISCASALVFS